MYFDQATVNRLKETPITSYLHSLGIEPVRSSGQELIYCSPLTGERSPSFYVNPKKNRFNCFSSGEKGDVIRLVSLVEKIPFKPACERLCGFDAEQPPSFSFSGLSIASTSPQASELSAMTLLDERALFNRVLMDYVMSRGIPPALAKLYLYEIRYLNKNRAYYAVGFKTDKDSYALRSKLFKGWLGVSAIRTIPVAGSNEIDLFEGFFDFLSYLTMNRLVRPVYTTIILNSTTNLKQALSALEGAKRINCYFDNDTAGRAAYGKLQAVGFPVKDRSSLYANHNDLNELLQQKSL
jgi:DNA primase